MMAADPITAIGNVVSGIIDRIWPNPNEAEKARIEALKVAMASEMAIHATNQEEAKHPSIFVAGWRPAVGWLCAAGIGYSFLLQPLLAWACLMSGVEAPPVLDIGHLISLLVGMLGFGAYRTYEGAKGAKRTSWPVKETKL